MMSGPPAAPAGPEPTGRPVLPHRRGYETGLVPRDPDGVHYHDPQVRVGAYTQLATIANLSLDAASQMRTTN